MKHHHHDAGDMLASDSKHKKALTRGPGLDMNIGGSVLYGMYQSAAGIHANMAFHAEIPLIALFRLAHFGIPLILSVLRGAGS